MSDNLFFLLCVVLSHMMKLEVLDRTVTKTKSSLTVEKADFIPYRLVVMQSPWYYWMTEIVLLASSTHQSLFIVEYLKKVYYLLEPYHLSLSGFSTRL